MNSWPSIWNLVSEIVGRKNAAEFFLYLPIFKLNLKVYHFHLILGPATNQKWFKHTFQQCIVCSVFEIACSFDFQKTWRNLLQNRELLKKVMKSYKNLAFSKVIVWFESRCSHLNFRYRVCFKQGVPWHSGNYRVWIHSETRTWHDKNIQSFYICVSSYNKSY